MACSSCSSSKDGAPSGCQSKGHCASGGCNKLNTYDWLSSIEPPQCDKFDIVEVSFKNGARKAFYRLPDHVQLYSSDTVVVEASNGGYDIGHVSLMGELVRLQMRKKRTADEAVAFRVQRVANMRDHERLLEARDKEKTTMVHGRVIARSLGLDMKISDVEYQGDKRKATFYYTADGRVDFRELIRHYAKEFRVKIEMRQIGARQESARIGGLGSCGRELCCSTWLTDFKSVSTTAARYQNLAINQSKLSGQCGRLKCCLNYELDTYVDALKDFPKHADKLLTEAGTAYLLKTDIFQRTMFYTYRESMGKTYALSVERVKEIVAENKEGRKMVELIDSKYLASLAEEEVGFEDGSGEIELPPEKRRRKKRRNNRRKPSSQRQGGGARQDNKQGSGKTQGSSQKQSSQRSGQKPQGEKPQGDKPQGDKEQPRSNSRRRGRGRGGRTLKSGDGTQKPQSNDPKQSAKPKNTGPKTNAPKNTGPKPPAKSGDKPAGDGKTGSNNRRGRGRNNRNRKPKPPSE